MRTLVLAALSLAAVAVPAAALAQTITNNNPVSQYGSQDFRNRIDRAKYGAGPVRAAEFDPAVVLQAKTLARKHAVPCTVGEVAAIKSGRERVASNYELSCREGMGWVVSQSAAYECMALEASAAAAGKGALQCGLKANADHVKSLSGLVQKAGVKNCTVADGKWLGSGGQPPISRYEIACTGSTGYIVDAPALGSKAEYSSMTCDEAKAAGLACTLDARKKG